MAGHDSAASGRTVWVAVDWGTSNMRAWALDGQGNVIAQGETPRGMNAIAADPSIGFEDSLLAVIDPWLPVGQGDVIPVVICGMAGARQGWREAPYCRLPHRPDRIADHAIRPQTRDGRLCVHILPGVKQFDAPDVMRGEETQLAGIIAQMPGFAGWVCLPGTHSKWAEIRDGQITRFRTFMTGEIFALLRGQSILRHSMADPWQDDVFAASVRHSQAHPTAFLNSLFSIRAAGLVGDDPSAPASSFSSSSSSVSASVPPFALPSGQSGIAALSGALIGQELCDILPLLDWQNSAPQIAIVGDGKLAGLYRRALALFGIDALQTDGETVTLAGLKLAFRGIADAADHGASHISAPQQAR